MGNTGTSAKKCVFKEYQNFQGWIGEQWLRLFSEKEMQEFSGEQSKFVE